MMAQRNYTELRWISVGPTMAQRNDILNYVGSTLAQRNVILNYVGPTLDQHWLKVGKSLAPTVDLP